MQELAVEFGEGFQHVKYEAALQQLRLFSFTHRRICGDLTSFMVFWNSPWSSFPTRRGLRGHAHKFDQPPTPIRIQRLCCSILEKTVGRGFQSSNSEALQNTPGRHLAASIPTSVQITYPLSQLIIPFADPTYTANFTCHSA